MAKREADTVTPPVTPAPPVVQEHEPSGDPAKTASQIIAVALNKQAADVIVRDARGNMAAMRKRLAHIMTKQGRGSEIASVDAELAAIIKNAQ